MNVLIVVVFIYVFLEGLLFFHFHLTKPNFKGQEDKGDYVQKTYQSLWGRIFGGGKITTEIRKGDNSPRNVKRNEKKLNKKLNKN